MRRSIIAKEKNRETSIPFFCGAHFCQLLLTAFSSAASTRVFSSEQSEASLALLHEVARDLPLNTDADVIVCGACPAGVSGPITAVAAKNKTARNDVPWSEVQPVIAKVGEQA